MKEDSYPVVDCRIWGDMLFLFESATLGIGLNNRRVYSTVSLADIASSEIEGDNLILKDGRSGSIKLHGSKEQLEYYKKIIDSIGQPHDVADTEVDRSKLSRAVGLYIDTTGDYPSITNGADRLGVEFSHTDSNRMSLVILGIFNIFNLNNKVDVETALQKIKDKYPELNDQALEKVIAYAKFSGYINE